MQPEDKKVISDIKPPSESAIIADIPVKVQGQPAGATPTAAPKKPEPKKAPKKTEDRPKEPRQPITNLGIILFACLIAVILISYAVLIYKKG